MRHAGSEDILDVVPVVIREDWPRASFEAHLASLDRHGPHLGDLYLAGAAAHRVPSAWTHLERTFAAPFTSRVRGQPLAGLEPEELWARVRTRQMEPSRSRPSLARIGDYLGLVSLLHYLVVAGLRTAISERRRRGPTSEASLRTRGPDVDDENGRTVGVLDAVAREDGPSPDELSRAAAEIETAFARCLHSLDASDRALLRLVCHAGLRQREAARILGWHEVRVSRRLTALREILAAAVDPDLVCSGDPRLRGLIATGLRRWIAEGIAGSTASSPSAAGGEA